MHLLIPLYFCFLILYRRDFNIAKKSEILIWTSIFFFQFALMSYSRSVIALFLLICISHEELWCMSENSPVSWAMNSDLWTIKITPWNSFWSVTQNAPLWHWEWVALCLVRRNFSYETKAVAAEEQRTEVTWSTSDRSASMWNH